MSGVNLATPKNKLVFPYGVQSFERKEYVKAGQDITVLPGWGFNGAPSAVSAVIDELPSGLTLPGTQNRRWVDIEDLGGGTNQGFHSPEITAPSEWNYQWQFRFLIDAPPAGVDGPALAVQHFGNTGYQDAWGIRVTSTGAELYMTDKWGVPQTAELFQYTGVTSIGEW